MKMTTVYARQTLRRDLDEVFSFFSDAGNLAEVTPPWLSFRILTPDVEMRVGTTIDYRLRLAGIPFGWTSEITAWEPGRRFVDEQLKGPYRVWIHEHRFERQGSSTVVEDVVQYATPGGAIVNALFVRPQVKKIFTYRQKIMGEKFGRAGGDVLEVMPSLRGSGRSREWPPEPARETHTPR